MDSSAIVYDRFARLEAHDVSPLYESWALGIAADPEIQSLIEALPRLKWQPNLIFASARWNGAPLADYPLLRDWLLEHWTDVVDTAMFRSTQTNEAGRCSVLLPQLSQLSGPIALLEVGASAGLCLYTDRYSYQYQTPDGLIRLDPTDGPSSVLLTCEILGDIELPRHLPEVVWRGGIDLAPIDLFDQDSADWLETLIWPEHDERRARLRAAAALVRADPPLLVAGDLNEQLTSLAAMAPTDATLVVFHSAVLAYLSPESREQFVSRVTELDAVWLSNEDADVLPEVRAALPEDIDARGDFILARDGTPVALTGGHGQTYRPLV